MILLLTAWAMFTGVLNAYNFAFYERNKTFYEFFRNWLALFVGPITIIPMLLLGAKLRRVPRIDS